MNVKSEPGPQVVLITGASRGIGAEVAVQLADPHRHLIVNYREKARRANDVVEAVRAAGGDASTAKADLTDERAVVGMLDDIRGRFGRLDVLALNASGGMERAADPGYAIQLNRDAQESLARLSLPLMPPGGRIVFITSHQAHFCGRTPVPHDYLPVAVSKRAGEDALRAMRPMFAAREIAFVVVSGDMIDGTVTVRLLERRDPDAVAARRAVAPLPSVSEFARAIVRAIHARDYDGETIYVGGPDYLQ
jgi:NAD(P)-dependent dehydrogenase (short-subunit alcohol dehydrogenase family)